MEMFEFAVRYFRPKYRRKNHKVNKLRDTDRYFELTGNILAGNNVINTDILKDVIANPHEYEHLMWHENGNTVKFCDMSYDKQLEIIKSLG